MTEWPDRDAFSDGLPVMGCIRAGEIIPAAQKSQTEMPSAGRNNPCGTKEPDRDASDRGQSNPYGTKEPDRDAFSRAK